VSNRYTVDEAEKASLPGSIDSLITEFGRLLIIRCLRPDRLIQTVIHFITKNMGSKFIEPPIIQLQTIFDDSNKRSPLIFILSPGIDPASTLQQLAEDKHMASNRYYTLSLGQGQASAARRLLELGMKKVRRNITCVSTRLFDAIVFIGSLDISCQLSSIDKLAARTRKDR
jgi:dynein heavy chain, axonemal